jgi:hypothetical protein
MSHLSILPPPAPPVRVGQLVTVHSYGEELPGTVASVRPLDVDRFEVRVEVLANFGVGVSRHIIDGAGHEVDRRTSRHGLICA